jgi:hypothetical protein
LRTLCIGSQVGSLLRDPRPNSPRRGGRHRELF